ncbi:MAG: single-stranded-DNA-specific exonuclease RecJ [Fibrobacter sp.]|uniref:single-stranded-DNA-specific exonuclease RecJ n=1 Tax=Fibrobacter sp. TaxID=35828 RepID=UPI002A911840|nr:single-stranded-DNA-specific exonuclease RecJ [Fibrobacter sp.]MDY6265370.1 single-stranded-DNA-specific exonuclease RecJ [Fibrobacter sp.]
MMPAAEDSTMCNEELLASSMAQSLRIPHAVARFLVARGVRTLTEAHRMLCGNADDVHDPFLMKGMEEAVAWLLDVRERGEKVFVFGDYDLDGMTAVTLMTRALAELGIESDWRLPNRFGDGYGLSVSAVEEMHSAGARNVITVDTGITANAEIALAKKLGMSVLVIDHHQPSGEGLPECDVLLDPHQEGDTYPNPELCGVGVSYKFICALYSRLGMPEPKKFLDLVALGTLADLVQMTPENHSFTKAGLKSIEGSCWPGLQEMYGDLMKRHGSVGGIDVMYKFAPLLNAPGRMERPDPALKLLLSPNMAAANALMAELKEWNSKRKQKEAEITDMALEQVKAKYGDKLPTVLVVAGNNWHVGVIGIVAAKLAQEYHRPTAVLSITDGMAHASARAVPGFNWHKALFESRDLFDRWGGHANAAGFSLPSDKIDELRERLEQSAKVQNYTGAVEELPAGAYPYDIRISLNELVVEAEQYMSPDGTTCPGGKRLISILDFFDLLEPFSGNFPYPTFRADNIKVHRLRELRGGHLQMDISQAGSRVFPAIAFGLRKSKALLHGDKPVSVIFEPTWNYFNDRKSMQLCIKAIEPCD